MNVSFTDNKYKVKVSYPLKQGLKHYMEDDDDDKKDLLK